MFDRRALALGRRLHFEAVFRLSSHIPASPHLAMVLQPKALFEKRLEHRSGQHLSVRAGPSAFAHIRENQPPYTETGFLKELRRLCDSQHGVPAL